MPNILAEKQGKIGGSKFSQPSENVNAIEISMRHYAPLLEYILLFMTLTVF